MREIEDIHVPFLAWLKELGVWVTYHRPDRKSGIQTGHPDFMVAWMKRFVFIEAKTPEGLLSKVQENVHAFIRASGNTVVVCRSLEECKEAVRKYVLHDGFTEAFSKNGKNSPPIGLNAALVLAEPLGIRTTDAKSREGRRSGEARESTEEDRLAVNTDSRGGVQFYIGSWNGNFYVFAPDRGGAFRMIREASSIDRIRFPKLPA
jgi:hypothetical protein